MVNYCCVVGCGRNNKTSKHLFYYGLPKEQIRLEQWLQVIAREDLLRKNLKKLSYRVCSRHFSPADIKNKHLCSNAVPTLCLPNSDCQEEEEQKQVVHEEIACDSCKKPIIGFRYKCITCPDFDLCSKCELLEAHPDHYLLRIPKPVNYKVADDLIKKWQQLVKVKIEHVTVDELNGDASSDDDIPIKMYVTQYDNKLDIPEDVKAKIRNEVTRVLNIKHIEPKKRKRDYKRKENNKKKKAENSDSKICGTKPFVTLDNSVPEVAFADVNDLRGVQLLDIKDEISTNISSTSKGPDQIITDLDLTDADFILTSLN